MPGKFKESCFIDTNIWLYAFVKSNEPIKTESARRLIRAVQPYVSTQVINEICVNLIQKAHFGEGEIARLIGAFYQKYTVIEVRQNTMLAASRLRESYALSFWDSMVIAAALEAGVLTLYSEDLQNGLIIEEKLRIINPFANSPAKG